MDVGNYLGEVMHHPWFNRACEEFEKTTSHLLLSTKQGASAEREQIYQTYDGAKQFLEFLASIVKTNDTILQQRAIQDRNDEPSDEELEDWFADAREDREFDY